MRIARHVVLCALVALAVSPAAASAEADRAATVSAAAPAFEWEGAMATGYNTARDPQACSKDVETYCDLSFITLDLPAGQLGDLQVDIGEYFGPQCTPVDGQNAPCDFSLWLYQADASGKIGKNLGNSVNDSGEPETVVKKGLPGGHYMVVVFYYTVAQSSFAGSLKLSNITGPPAVEAPAAKTPAAPLTASLAPAGKASFKRFGVELSCSAACSGRLVASISAATARKLKLGRKALVVASAAVSGPGVVTLKLSKKVLARLKKAKSLKITVEAQLGSATASRALTLRR
jgi:hypothetical protein